MSTSPLEQFVKKVQTAKNYNSKELRITLLEAEELSIAISLLLSKTTSAYEQIISLQNDLLDAKNITSIEMSGGKF